MGLGEEMIHNVRNKDKKTKEKSSKDKKDDNIRRGRSLDDGLSSEYRSSERGDIEKKKKVKYRLETQGSDGGYAKRAEDDSKKESEFREQKNHNANAVEKVKKKKRKDSDRSGGSDHRLQEPSFEDFEGRSTSGQHKIELQNGPGALATVGLGSDRMVVMSEHKKIKKKRKTSESSLDLGAEQQNWTFLNSQEILENDYQQRQESKAFGGSPDLESSEKGVRKNKRKGERDKSIIPEDQWLGHDFDDPEGKRRSNFSERDNIEKLKETDVGLIAEDAVVMKDKKRKKKSTKNKGDLVSGADTTVTLKMDSHLNNETEGKQDEARSAENLSEISKTKEVLEKVSFSGEDEVIAGDDFVMKYKKKKKKTTKNRKGDLPSSTDTTVTLDTDRHLDVETEDKQDEVENVSEDPKTRKGKKKVSFSGQDEVFAMPEEEIVRGRRFSEEEVFAMPEEEIVRGKRFSEEEDEMIRAAVYNYIETKGLGEEGLDMVLNCKSNPKTKNCWKEIAAALPHRPRNSVYLRAHALLRRSQTRKWTKEEMERLRGLHEKYGNKWKALGDELGKYRRYVKDTWRNIRHENMNHGKWSQEEYQSLFNLVNLDLRMKHFQEKHSKHGMLRDNIPWTAISDKLTTRAEPACCVKWYGRLTSPMVAEKLWLDSDDYRLLDALYQLDATCYDDVDWDNLLEHRSGDLTQRRWNEMVRHIGDGSKKPFPDQVEILSKRYCPELLDARENWENKPYVP